MKPDLKRAYIILLKLYPGGHRALFAAEMSNAFGEGLEECGNRGFVALTRFIYAEIRGVVAGAAVVWSEQIRHAVVHNNRPAPCGCLPDFRKMRPPWREAKSFYALLRAPLKVK